MDVLRFTSTRSVNLPLAPKRSNPRVLPDSVRFRTATLKLPKLSISRQERDVFVQRGDASFLQTTPLTPIIKPLKTPNPFTCKASTNPLTHPKKQSPKPKWFWRTLASIPYLYPLHNIYQYADTVYHLHHVVKKYDFLTYRFLDTIALLPNWVVMSVFMGTYFLVVRRKEWPHFFRYHVAMALLINTGMQVFGMVCNWMPKSVFRGDLMVCFWMTVAFLQGITVLECMRCALGGIYANVPLVSDTAFIHSDPKMLN